MHVDVLITKQYISALLRKCVHVFNMQNMVVRLFPCLPEDLLEPHGFSSDVRMRAFQELFTYTEQ